MARQRREDGEDATRRKRGRKKGGRNVRGDGVVGRSGWKRVEREVSEEDRRER